MDSLKQYFYNSKNISKKEEIYQKIKTLEKTKIPVFDELKIDELQAKISELKKIDGNKYLEQKLIMGRSLYINNSIQLSGTITFVIIES